jgi:hypothetical protein
VLTLVIIGTATATDNCSVIVTGSRSDGKSLNEAYPFGLTTITWTAEDPSGNTATSTQTININRVTTTTTVTVTPGTQHTVILLR